MSELDYLTDVQRLAALAHRFATLAVGVPEPLRLQRLVSTPAWTPHDLVAHVADLVHRYAEAFGAGTTFAPTWDSQPTWTSQVAAPYRARPYDEVAGLIAEAAEPLAPAGAAADPDRLFRWQGGAEIPVRGGVGVTINELLVHGWDLASGTGGSWPLDPADITAGLGWALHALGPAIDAAKAAGHTATYELRLRDGGTLVLPFVDGVPQAGTVGARRPDVVMSAPARTLLLTMYGRKPFVVDRHHRPGACLGPTTLAGTHVDLEDPTLLRWPGTPGRASSTFVSRRSRGSDHCHTPVARPPATSTAPRGGPTDGHASTASCSPAASPSATTRSH